MKTPLLPQWFAAALLLASLPAWAQPPAPPPAPAPTPAPAPVPAPAPAPKPAAGNFGQPLAGLTAAEMADFLAGQANFEEVETAETGLGPIFNNVSCVACHAAPAPGGNSAVTVTRFGRNVGGVFDPLTELDGTLLHAHAIAPVLQEVVPAEANVTTLRLTTPLFGAGLIEAIPDSVIIQNAQQEVSLGASGQVSYVTDAATGETRVGRFGWKAQHATLLSFAGDAYNNEIGVTNRVFPIPHAPDGNTALLARFVNLDAPPEDVTDPVTGKADIDRFSDFMRLLAPPTPAPATPQSELGSHTFAAIGCASCHTPSLNTGPNASAALSNQTVALYSDLLLHDMGSLGDGIAQAAASPAQMRTAPLWGLHARPLYLHDGRATTVDEAIRAHDGEAKAAQQTYLQLTPAAQQQLLAFLNTL